MKLFGSLTELVSLIFRKNSQTITLRPNQTTTYTAARDIQLPEGDAAHIIVSRTSTDTLTNKSISGSSNTITNIPAGTAITGQLPTANGGTGQNSTATFPTSGVVVTETATETLTNKTINGNNNTLTVLAASQLSGATPIANGGTGQTSATAAFNALDPLTTKGDLITNNGTDSVRLGVGTDTYVLTADSSQTTGIKWAPGGSGSPASADGDTAGVITTFTPTVKSSVHTVSSADYTFLNNDGYRTLNIANGGANRTVTLPAATDSVGRIVTIKKTDSGNQVIITAGTGDTLDVYNITATGPSTISVLDIIGMTVTLQCTSSTTWTVIDGGCAITSYSLSGSGVFTAGALHLRKVQQRVYGLVTGVTTWGGAGVTRNSASGLIATAFRPGEDVTFCGNTISGDAVYFIAKTDGTLTVATGGATAMPFGFTMAGSYFLRG